MSTASENSLLVQHDDRSGGAAGSPAIVLYRTRWLQLLVFSLLSASNACMWISYAPVTLRAAQHWDVKPVYINALSLAYMVVFVPLLLPSAMLVDRLGLRAGLLAGAALNVAGGWVRWAGHAPGTLPGFALQAAGQLLAAIAQTFLLEVPAKLAANWFGASERGFATAVAAMFNQVGIAVGFLLAPLVVPADEPFAKGISNLLLYNAIAAAVVALLVAILFRSNPPTPPSASAGARNDASAADVGGAGGAIAGSGSDAAAGKRADGADADGILDRRSATEDDTAHHGHAGGFGTSLKQLMRSRSFLLLLAAFGIGTGSFYSLSTLLNQILKPSGYNADAAGEFGFVLCVVGIFAAIGISWLADRTGKLKLLLALSFGAQLASLVWLAVSAMRKGQQAQLYACVSVLGAATSSIMPLSFEVAAESTYPVSEELSSGVLLASAQLFGILLTLATDSLAPVVGGYQNAVYLFVALSAVSTLLVLLVRVDGLRSAVDKRTAA